MDGGIRNRIRSVAQESEQHRAARAAMFSSELLRRIDAIARAVEAAQLPDAAQEANALATGALAFGLSALGEDATRVERIARQGDRLAVQQAFCVLQCGVHEALAELRARA
ncbi:Hpt domain-containing protein [Elioraea rosea]|uniref:Hpt domain-containing protein n=1 Tax=Elioraea rosea TaxID=2492390 RepID=UPI0011841E17|nr:Hpt domain-containing protein [Elioraea rosea]